MSDVYSFGVLLAFLFTGKHSPTVPPDVQVRALSPLVTLRLQTHLSCACVSLRSLAVSIEPSTSEAHSVCVSCCAAVTVVVSVIVGILFL